MFEGEFINNFANGFVKKFKLDGKVYLEGFCYKGYSHGYGREILSKEFENEGIYKNGDIIYGVITM